jgi:thiosulfate dehydrogenase [quinone] large subunit
MSVIHHRRDSADAAAGASAPAEPGRRQAVAARRTVALLRIAFGFTFLWAFFDKLLALGYHTGYDQAGHLDRFGDAAWIHGGSPTEGFLKFGADGPFEGFYHSIAGDAWADWLFMLGLLGVGVALTAGAGMRIAAAAGALMYLMMWTVVLPPENNPVIDEHVLGAITVVALALLDAGDTWGLGRWWRRTSVVRKHPALV